MSDLIWISALLVVVFASVAVAVLIFHPPSRPFALKVLATLALPVVAVTLALPFLRKRLSSNSSDSTSEVVEESLNVFDEIYDKALEQAQLSELEHKAAKLISQKEKEEFVRKILEIKQMPDRQDRLRAIAELLNEEKA